MTDIRADFSGIQSGWRARLSSCSVGSLFSSQDTTLGAEIQKAKLKLRAQNLVQRGIRTGGGSIDREKARALKWGKICFVATWVCRLFLQLAL
jgi:hypothetical protein